MTKEGLITKIGETLGKLPKEKVLEVAEFADFVLKRFEDESLTEAIQMLANSSASFDFLSDEEDLYSTKDIKERY